MAAVVTVWSGPTLAAVVRTRLSLQLAERPVMQRSVS